MAVCSRIRQFHPASREAEPEPSAAQPAAPKRRRGRPKGSQTAPRSVPVRHPEFLGVRYADHSVIPPAFWNLLCSLVTALFRGLLKIAKKLEVEAPGHVQERVLFRELPQLLLGVVREVANWWWSFDRGFLGTTLKCPTCGGDLKFKGDVKKGIKTPFGVVQPRRSYYRCDTAGCDTSVWPLDRRLGLDGDAFLPSVQELIVWLTSLDPYGKCLQYVAKLLHFSVCHRSAWLLTQKVGSVVKEREDEAIARAFADPRNPVFPQAEVTPPKVGVLMFDGTCGRIDKDEAQPREDTVAEVEDPDAPDKPADFREVKLGLAAHLVPPVPKPVATLQEAPPPATEAPEASQSPPTRKKKRGRKVRAPGQEPTLAHKKLTVHLGSPLRLFQIALLLVHRLAMDKARTLLVIGDGAHWIWCGVRDHLSSLGVQIVEILDYWHAVEHLWKSANALYGQGTREAVAWVKAREAELLKGKPSDFFSALEAFIEEARQASDQIGKDLVSQLEKELTYFRNNEARIHYADYLSKGYLIGSGAMEGSCRHHVKERIDRGGMQWSAQGAMNVLLNRTLIKNGDWDDFWSDEAHRRWSNYRTLTTALAL